MSSLASIAQSGMQAAQTALQVSANNVANLGTQGYVPEKVNLTAQASGGVQASVSSAPGTAPSLTADLVAQLQAKNAFLSNLAVFKTSSSMAGALLDQHV